MTIDLPRLLTDFERPSGVLKADYEDFVVEEVPLYPIDNAGTHTFFLLEKKGLSTMQAAADVARALGRAPRDIGFAGLKDARAVTRQWMSIEHVPPERVLEVSVPRLRVVEAKLHGNKLRLGHLRGNRFLIRVRNVDEARFGHVKAAFEQLVQRGCPNYFGPQRFGSRGDSWKVGRAFLGRDPVNALDAMLGRPLPDDEPALYRARELYDQGDYQGAARAWPPMFATERRALRTLVASQGRKKRAAYSIEPHMQRLYISAFQSHLFNQVVAARLPRGLDKLMVGDLAMVHGPGAVFRVLDAAVEQPRADRGEISPTGPLFGYRMTPPTDEPLQMEQAVFASCGLDASSFRGDGVRIKGARRALRFPIADAQIDLGADARGPYLEFRFGLPKGCYATSVLRELIVSEGAVEEAETDEE